MRQSGGSGLSDFVPPHIVNPAHHLIGTNGHTYELALRRAEEVLKARVPRQVLRDMGVPLLFRSLDRCTNCCEDEPLT